MRSSTRLRKAEILSMTHLQTTEPELHTYTTRGASCWPTTRIFVPIRVYYHAMTFWNFSTLLISQHMLISASDFFGIVSKLYNTLIIHISWFSFKRNRIWGSRCKKGYLPPFHGSWDGSLPNLISDDAIEYHISNGPALSQLQMLTKPTQHITKVYAQCRISLWASQHEKSPPETVYQTTHVDAYHHRLPYLHIW